MAQLSNDVINLRVRYKFKGDKNFIEITVTEEQYVNFLEVEAIESCEIIHTAKKPITPSEKKAFNQRILVACQNDQSHTKYLLE